MGKQINRVRNWKQFLNESMENKLPSSITIKLNDSKKFSKRFRYSSLNNGFEAAYNHNYVLLAYSATNCGVGIYENKFESTKKEFYPKIDSHIKETIQSLETYMKIPTKSKSNW